MLTRREFLERVATAAVAGPAMFHAATAAIPPPTRHTASMWIYLWDLVDEGYDVVLPRLREHALTSISLATAYHTGKFLAPHNPRRKVVFLEDGTVMFRPNASLYGRISPMTHSLVSSGHDLREARRQADRYGMQLRSWVVCCHNTALGTAHPDLVTRTAFDDPLYHNLCPSNGDVRRYLRSLVTDVAAHGVDLIELEALQFQGYTHGFHHEREGVALTPATRFLLGLCFCAACRRGAKESGFDIQPVLNFTAATLEEFFRDPDTINNKYPTIDQLPADILEPFLRWRSGVITSLLEELKSGAGTVELRQMMSIDSSAWKLTSVDPAASARTTGGILALGYVRDGVALDAPLTTLRSLLGGKALTLGFQVGLPESGGQAEFLDRMRVARAQGITSFNFYNYGFIPLKNLAWITQALS
jgi:hypothetical protein